MSRPYLLSLFNAHRLKSSCCCPFWRFASGLMPTPTAQLGSSTRSATIGIPPPTGLPPLCRTARATQQLSTPPTRLLSRSRLGPKLVRLHLPRTPVPSPSPATRGRHSQSVEQG